jgi:hypothetical protein
LSGSAGSIVRVNGGWGGFGDADTGMIGPATAAVQPRATTKIPRSRRRGLRIIVRPFPSDRGHDHLPRSRRRLPPEQQITTL